MSAYAKYKDLLGLPYIEGTQDCYGLLRQYYAINYGLSLRNYARPLDFADSFDLISQNFSSEGFIVLDVSLDRLQIGDGLLFRLNNKRFVNHVGAFVGNGYVLHHLYQRLSSIDALTQVWKNRVVSVVRHPEVVELNKGKDTLINFRVPNGFN